MTVLNTLQNWLKTYPGAAQISDWRVDFTANIPGLVGTFPAGIVENSRKKDVLGNVTITNTYNFGLYFVCCAPDQDEAEADANAAWLTDFQEWVQAQSVLGLAPAFGDDPRRETITAQNGALYGTNDEGTALYMVQLAVQCQKEYRSDALWQR